MSRNASYVHQGGICRVSTTFAIVRALRRASS
jgi:hypothetical protein